MIPKEIAIIGHPSKLGGADTELFHQMKAWIYMGIHCHVIHTGEIDANLQKLRLGEMRGVTLHEPLDWRKAAGMPVISYCNGKFLREIENIRKYATATWWVNCMCHLFSDERDAHERGLIDRFIYQTSRVREHVGPMLREINPAFRSSVVRPYFDASTFKFTPDPPDDRFRFCKVSREDIHKYHPSTLWLYENMTAPVLKEGHLLGWDPEKMPDIAGGNLPEWIKGYRAGQVDPQDLYARCHALIHFARPSQTENLPRVGFEAMATGTIIVADNRGGWTDQVIDGTTGWLCDTDREFSYKASRVAHEKKERIEMAKQARVRLEDLWGLEAACSSWESFFREAANDS